MPLSVQLLPSLPLLLLLLTVLHVRKSSATATAGSSQSLYPKHAHLLPRHPGGLSVLLLTSLLPVPLPPPLLQLLLLHV